MQLSIISILLMCSHLRIARFTATEYARLSAFGGVGKNKQPKNFKFFSIKMVNLNALTSWSDLFAQKDYCAIINCEKTSCFGRLREQFAEFMLNVFALIFRSHEEAVWAHARVAAAFISFDFQSQFFFCFKPIPTQNIEYHFHSLFNDRKTSRRVFCSTTTVYIFC